MIYKGKIVSCALLALAVNAHAGFWGTTALVGPIASTMNPSLGMPVIHFTGKW